VLARMTLIGAVILIITYPAIVHLKIINAINTLRRDDNREKAPDCSICMLKSSRINGPKCKSAYYGSRFVNRLCSNRRVSNNIRQLLIHHCCTSIQFEPGIGSAGRDSIIDRVNDVVRAEYILGLGEALKRVGGK